jgi:hypothetical protein
MNLKIESVFVADLAEGENINSDGKTVAFLPHRYHDCQNGLRMSQGGSNIKLLYADMG